jgi:signal transduction histidine kinase
MQLRQSKVPVIQFVSYLVEAISPLAERRDIEIVTQFPDNEHHEFFDVPKMEKVILNLLSNAIKFTEPAGKITITLSFTPENWILEVRDTGIGISLENQKRVFDRFTQVDSSASRKHDGTGIGLALVQELVKLHRGEIILTSELGKGSSFEVRLPRLDISDAPAFDFKGYTQIDRRKEERRKRLERRTSSRRINFDRRQELSKTDLVKAMIRDKGLSSEQKSQEILVPPTSAESIKHKPNLLLVDDNPDMLKILILALKKEYNLTTAFDGAQALREAKKIKPDLIISDIMMPVVSGSELCQRIKADADLRHTPIILITSKVEMTSKLDSFEQGADDYITKPFDTRELSAKIKALLHLKEMIAEFNQLEKMNSIGRLAAGLSHEINNPLTLITANIGTLTETLNQFQRVCAQEASFSREEEINRLKEKSALLLGLMEKGCKQAVTVIETVKSFSRMDEPVLQECLIEDGLNSTLNLVSSDLTKYRIKVHKEFTFNRKVACYPGLLNQAFFQLLSNSILAIAETGKPGNVWVSTAESAGEVVFSVQNDGPPINTRIQSRIFDPFFTTRDIGRGRGMGLSVCYGILRKHGGTITCKNVDNGVSFVCQFPIMSLTKNALPLPPDAGLAP